MGPIREIPRLTMDEDDWLKTEAGRAWREQEDALVEAGYQMRARYDRADRRIALILGVLGMLVFAGIIAGVFWVLGS
jgi:hypothetical protein